MTCCHCDQKWSSWVASCSSFSPFWSRWVLTIHSSIRQVEEDLQMVPVVGMGVVELEVAAQEEQEQVLEQVAFKDLNPTYKPKLLQLQVNLLDPNSLSKWATTINHTICLLRWIPTLGLCLLTSWQTFLYFFLSLLLTAYMHIYFLLTHSHTYP